MSKKRITFFSDCLPLNVGRKNNCHLHYRLNSDSDSASVSAAAALNCNSRYEHKQGASEWEETGPQRDETSNPRCRTLTSESCFTIMEKKTEKRTHIWKDFAKCEDTCAHQIPNYLILLNATIMSFKFYLSQAWKYKYNSSEMRLQQLQHCASKNIKIK